MLSTMVTSSFTAGSIKPYIPTTLCTVYKSRTGKLGFSRSATMCLNIPVASSLSTFCRQSKSLIRCTPPHLTTWRARRNSRMSSVWSCLMVFIDVAELLKDENHQARAAKPFCMRYASYIDERLIILAQTINLSKIANNSTAFVRRKNVLHVPRRLSSTMHEPLKKTAQRFWSTGAFWTSPTI